MDEQTTMGMLALGLIVFLVAFDKVKNPNGRQDRRPQGYVPVQKDKLPAQTKWCIKEKIYECDENNCSTGRLRTGYVYFEGKNYRYAVYYNGNGNYDVFSQRKW
jgi:hypothetical protein